MHPVCLRSRVLARSLGRSHSILETGSRLRTFDGSLSSQPAAVLQKNISSSAVAMSQPSIPKDLTERLAAEKAEHEAAVAEGREFLAARGYDVETIWSQVVCWGDHDQFQHVNNVHYLRWFESGRMSWAANLAQKLSAEKGRDIVKGTGKSFILAGCNIRYKIPVTYPDTMLIAQTVLLPLNEAKDRFMLRGAAYSLKRKAIVCTADQDCVSYDYNSLKKSPLDPELRKLIEDKGTTEWK